MSIYNRMESLIKAKGMTKKAFCKELGISTGNLGDWKRGKSTPSTNKLIEIAAFFQVSLDWLLTGREHLDLPDRVRELSSAYIHKNMIEPAAELDPEEIRFIQEYIAFALFRKQQMKDPEGKD